MNSIKDYNSIIGKFEKKSVEDCYKQLWQWIKQNKIDFLLFKKLCAYIEGRRNNEAVTSVLDAG